MIGKVKEKRGGRSKKKKEKITKLTVRFLSRLWAFHSIEMIAEGIVKDGNFKRKFRRNFFVEILVRVVGRRGADVRERESGDSFLKRG